MDEKSKNRSRIFLMGGTKDSINIIKLLKEGFDNENSPENSSENSLENSSENSSENSPYILATTTTDYGGKIAKDAGADEVIDKPLLKEEILDILDNNPNKSDNGHNNNSNNNSNNNNNNNFDVFIDATHPYASNVTKTAIEASKLSNIPYIRFERPSLEYRNNGTIYHVDSFEEAGKLIAKKWKNGNILHLAGVNTIRDVLKSVNIDNLYVRVLPVESSILKCNELGIFGEHIIAMQGIFSKEFNKSLMKELKAEVIITKESGNVGGVPAKLEAANDLKIAIIIIDRPKIDNLKDETVVQDLESLKNKLNSLIG
ncbi:precorrin-6A reductase [Methanobrevibacter cuticularis]|uniref:Precorrin-6A reductase n=1 Tax=Methanobrevibacter cuticularis TaxID=47311 RepID=A0A166D4B2_9EURY|nr:precorrin-6A reductase [Methanobrevibacter cuticularis]KZX15193.1 precorrin-6A reductase [Methanobrevibacter cuticularis]